MTESSEELTCVECGRRSGADSHGWRAYIGGFGGDEEVGIYCPRCAERESAGLTSRTRKLGLLRPQEGC